MILFQLRALILQVLGCDVYEDLSAVCSWGSYGVPW